MGGQALAPWQSEQHACSDRSGWEVMGTWELLVAWLSLLSSALPGRGPGTPCCYGAVSCFPHCFSLLFGELNLVLKGEGEWSK